MDLGFGGKVAVITGGAGGMGEGCARTLVAEGAQVVIADILDEKGQKLVKELGENTVYVHTDVTQYEDIRNMVDKAIEAFGTIDILINTAGILQTGSFSSIEEEVRAWDRMFAVHVRGTWLCIREVTTRVMIPKQYGKIVNISSLCNHSGQGGMSSYCTAKAAISQLTQGGARGLGRQGINMNCVSPGNVHSPMTEKVFFDSPDNPAWKRMKDEVVFGYIGEAMDIVPAIVFLCSDRAKWIVGADLNVSAGQVIY